jgi:hypothetical protein
MQNQPTYGNDQAMKQAIVITHYSQDCADHITNGKNPKLPHGMQLIKQIDLGSRIVLLYDSIVKLHQWGPNGPQGFLQFEF